MRILSGPKGACDLMTIECACHDGLREAMTNAQPAYRCLQVQHRDDDGDDAAPQHIGKQWHGYACVSECQNM